ncbi:low affinity immunoglobulin epsilon Fc receptor-like [Hypanus sabinus]|uniref:low affinity immunoglobulin epsilon Fc receptor-like n=1 Tax=Hypanus sabinus TaxID=79690 RepID=UPI0028C464DD|nr:low affinity immunoglobulin epsilon Fc receptor-like [Hypanus sabinus]
MDGSETYLNVKFTKMDSRSTSQDGLNSSYSELKFQKEEPSIDEDEDPPISSGPSVPSTTAETAAQEQESKIKIGNRPYRLIFLLCLVTSALIVTVAGLSIHVSQIRQSQITSGRNFQLFWDEYHEMNRTQRQCRLQFHELNSTLQSKILENSHLDLSQRTCLKNLSALNSNLSDLKRMHSDLRHQFTEMETKYRSVNETKAQICELLTSRRVSQIPESQMTCDRNFQLFWEECHEMNRTQRQCRLQVHELNSTLESTISEKSHLDLSRRTCLRNLSELNSNLFDLKRINSDHRHQFSEMETKYRSVNETKTQICELLTSRKGELTCPQNWIGNGDRCYFISSLEKPYDGAREHCSNFDARLLEINSKEEEEFVSISVGEESRTYWIGK